MIDLRQPRKMDSGFVECISSAEMLRFCDNLY